MKYFRSISIIVLLILFLLRAAEHTNAQVTADVTLGGTTGAISKNIWGVDFPYFLNMNPADTGNFYNSYIPPVMLDNVNSPGLGAQMYRFPGGCGADSYDITDGWLRYTFIDPVNGFTDASRAFFPITEAAAIANSNAGGELLFQANINGTDVPAFAQANICGETSIMTKNTQTLITELTAALSLVNTINYVELGNDQWVNWTPADYRNTAISFAQVLKQSKPTLKIGLVGYPSLAPPSQQKTDWDLMISNLKNYPCPTATNGLCFDFVTDHYYPRAMGLPAYPAPYFSGNAAYFPITNQDQIPQFMTNNSHSAKDYAMTEWNLSCGYNNDRVVMANTAEHGIFVFETLLQLAKNKVSMANYHDLSINPALAGTSACGLLTDNATLSASGLAFAMTSVAAGGEYYDVNYNNLTGAGSTVPIPVSNCADPDCVQNGGLNYTIMSTWGIRKGNDLYIFLVNRSDGNSASPQTINATVTLPILAGFTPTVNTYQLAAPTFQSYTFQPITIPDYTMTSNSFVVQLPPTSITRLRILNYFTAAPSPSPTLATLPTLNLTTIRKFINYRRTDNNECTQDLLIYIVAVAVYIMMIHFAIAMKEDFKMNLHVTCFIIGGVIGYYLCHLEIGFILGMILSLFLW